MVVFSQDLKAEERERCVCVWSVHAGACMHPHLVGGRINRSQKDYTVVCLCL